MGKGSSIDGQEKLQEAKSQLKNASEALEEYLSGCTEVEKFSFIGEVICLHSRAERGIALGREVEKSVSLKQSAKRLMKSKAVLGFGALGFTTFYAQRFLEEFLLNNELIDVWMSIFVVLALIVFVAWLVATIVTTLRYLIHLRLMRNDYGIEFDDALWERSGLQATYRDFGVFPHSFPYNDRVIYRAAEDYLLGRSAGLDDVEWLNRQTRYFAACLSIALHGFGEPKG